MNKSKWLIPISSLPLEEIRWFFFTIIVDVPRNFNNSLIIIYETECIKGSLISEISILQKMCQITILNNLLSGERVQDSNFLLDEKKIWD